MTMPPAIQRGLHHVAIVTRDWEGTTSFYRDGLGFTLAFGWETPFGQAAYFDAGDGSSSIEIYGLREDATFPEPVPEGPILHYCLATDDLDAAYARMQELGVKVLREPSGGTMVPKTGGDPISMRAFFIEGPTGELIEFKQTS